MSRCSNRWRRSGQTFNHTGRRPQKTSPGRVAAAALHYNRVKRRAVYVLPIIFIRHTNIIFRRVRFSFGYRSFVLNFSYYFLFRRYVFDVVRKMKQTNKPNDRRTTAVNVSAQHRQTFNHTGRCRWSTRVGSPPYYIIIDRSYAFAILFIRLVWCYDKFVFRSVVTYGNSKFTIMSFFVCFMYFVYFFTKKTHLCFRWTRT